MATRILANLLPAEADADAEGPDADHAVELAHGGGESRGHAIGIVEDVDGGMEAGFGERGGEQFGDAGALELGEIGRFFDHAVADEARQGDSDGANVRKA